MTLQTLKAKNTKAKEIIGNRFNFICGIELGQATHDFELAEKIVSDKRLDFVIGSTHKLPNYDDFAFIDYSKYDIPDLMEKYFDETYKLCKWGKFDVLGHLTYTLRYIEGDNGIKVDMNPYEEIIRESFKLLVENGKGIKAINSTSGGSYIQPKSYVEESKVSININDFDLFKLLSRVQSFITAWELTYAPQRIRQAKEIVFNSTKEGTSK